MITIKYFPPPFSDSGKHSNLSPFLKISFAQAKILLSKRLGEVNQLTQYWMTIWGIFFQKPVLFDPELLEKKKIFCAFLLSPKGRSGKRS